VTCLEGLQGGRLQAARKKNPVKEIKILLLPKVELIILGALNARMSLS